ncbi:hypothetical protein C6503_21055 [Candidatus Poribacteria bacterium]|nr:MAG: hypothetical protein C6503_21055 [Candidatus Poribacteria bacterium]
MLQHPKNGFTMNLQGFKQKLGVFAGVVVFFFNIVTTAQTDNRPQIRARVVYADGTPIANETIYILVLDRDLDASGGGSFGSTGQTDAEGYFVEILNVDVKPQFYVLGVAYHGHLAKAPPFILHKGQPEVHLLLTLNDNPVNPVPMIDRWGSDQIHIALEAFLEPPAVWAVNPMNGHAYKRIDCHNVMDAITQATAENAYLVSINDEVEHEWIQGVFDPDSFWIGLNDVAEEGRWVWASGEPVTYTNWETHERYGGNTEQNDYVISEWGGGKWQAVAPKDKRIPFLKQAILERAVLPVNTESDKQTDAQPTEPSTLSHKTTAARKHRSAPPQQIRSLSEIGIWAVNPANGHGYIKIWCEGLEEARDIADAQDAHLVAINDKTEQEWVLGLFGNHLYWIGLSDAEKEGEWVWQNGEPLTYENWGARHSFPRSTLSPEEKDSAVMTFLNGQWHAVGPGDLFWNVTKFAILEKVDVFDESPAKKNNGL